VKTPSVTKADGAAFFSERRSEKQCHHFQTAVFPYISLRFGLWREVAFFPKTKFQWILWYLVCEWQATPWRNPLKNTRSNSFQHFCRHFETADFPYIT